MEAGWRPVGGAADRGARAAYRVDLVAPDHLELRVAHAVAVEDDALRRHAVQLVEALQLGLGLGVGLGLGLGVRLGVGLGVGLGLGLGFGAHLHDHQVLHVHDHLLTRLLRG